MKAAPASAVSPKAITPGHDESMSVDSDTSTRDRLIAAARDAFLEQGYQATSVAEIARRAGLTTGAIYSNFTNKAGLLAAAIATEGLGVLGANLERAVRQDDPLERAVLLNTSVIAGAAAPVNRLVLEGWAAALHDHESSERVKHTLDMLDSMMLDQITRASASGHVADWLDTDALVAVFEAIVVGGLVRRALGRHQPDEAAVATIIRRLLASLAADEPGVRQAGEREPG